MKIGECASTTTVITEELVMAFSNITGDGNPIHTNKEFAKTSYFKEPIAQGMLIGSLISGVLGTKLPGPGCVYLKQNMKFLKPVKTSDTVTASVEIINIVSNESSSIVVLKTQCLNQAQQVVLIGEAIMKVF